MEINQNERVTGCVHKEVLFNLKWLPGFVAGFFTFPQNEKVSSYIQIFILPSSMRRPATRTMVGVAEPRRAHHLGSAEERTPRGVDVGDVRFHCLWLPNAK